MELKHKLKVKKIDLTAGGKFIVILNEKDAKDLDISEFDRVCLSLNGKKEVTAVVNLTETYVNKGEIGVFRKVSSELKLKNGQAIYLEPLGKPESVWFIKKKLDKEGLTAEEINAIIRDLMAGDLSDVELAAFVIGTYINGMNEEEVVALTNSIVNSGETVTLKRKPILDKHSTGGVPGNKTTMLIVPIVAAAGLTIPKTSSRAITSPAGTADTMEVLAPVDLDKKKLTQTVTKCNGCIAWGGSVNLAAADDKLIQVRRPLNLDPKAMLLASILAKKKAVGATHVLIDISVGKGAKVPTEEQAKELSDEFIEVGNKLGMKLECIITPGYDPIGFAIGPALEAREILRILECKDYSPDLREKGVAMAGILLELGGKASEGKGEALARKILESGKALKKMKEIIKAQGGNPNIKSDNIKTGKYKHDFVADTSGRIHYMETKCLSRIARIAGAPFNKGAGIYMYVEKGDRIKKGQKIFTIYAESQRKLDAAKALAEKIKPIDLAKVILKEYEAPEMRKF